MRVVEIEDGKGPAEALRIAQRPDPLPGQGEIRIQVRASGINRPDVLQRQGLYPPPPDAPDILGLEVAGVVEQVGEGVTRWRPGDRVCALLGGGGYAELAVVDARHVLPVPDGIDFATAACLPETVFTVFANVFEAGNLQPGQTLLVHGATSGIGVTAIQMARALGARVIATSRSARKAEAASALGAHISLDASTEDFGSRLEATGGADVILDMVGAAYAELNQSALRPGGRWVVIGTQSGALAQIDLLKLMMKRGVLTGSTLRRRSNDEKARLAAAIENQVWSWVASGQICPPIDAKFSLEQAGLAHLRLEAGEHIGKIVLTT